MAQNKLDYTVYYEHYNILIMIIYYLLLLDASERETSIVWNIYNLCLSMLICAQWKERVAMMTCVLLFLGVKLGLLFTRYLSYSVNYMSYNYIHSAFWDSLHTQPYIMMTPLNKYNNSIYKASIRIGQYG